MARRRLRRLALAAALASGALAPARAQDSAPDPASDPAAGEALARLLADWAVPRIGSSLPIGRLPVTATPTPQGFALSVPIAGHFPQWHLEVAGAPITATARRQQDGAWALDAIRYPSPLTVTLQPAAGAGRPPVVTTYAFAEQSERAVIDPSFATPSVWDTAIKGFTSTTADPAARGRATIAEWRYRTRWQPSGVGRVDVSHTERIDLFASNVGRPPGGPVSIAARHATSEHTLGQLAAAQVVPLHHAITDLTLALIERAAEQPPLPDLSTPGVHPPKLAPMTAQERATLLTLLDALGGLGGNVHASATADDVHVLGPFQDTHLNRLEGGFEASAPGDQLRVQARLVLQGLRSPMLDAQLPEGLRPRRIVIAPSAAGISASRLASLLRHAVESEGQDPTLAQQAHGLLVAGPVRVALDELVVDLGAAKLSATGEMHLAPDGSPLDGSAHIAAEGFEALFRATRNKQALPVLAMLKGYGRQEGATTVWDLLFRDGRLTVNGAELPLLR